MGQTSGISEYNNSGSALVTYINNCAAATSYGMNIKKNDNVIMLSGKDRGKTGKVLFVFPAESKVVVEGLNTVKRHQRAKREGQKGQVVSKERAVNISSVQLVCPKCGKPTRVSRKIESLPGHGKNKIRICKKCGAEV